MNETQTRSLAWLSGIASHAQARDWPKKANKIIRTTHRLCKLFLKSQGGTWRSQKSQGGTWRSGEQTLTYEAALERWLKKCK